MFDAFATWLYFVLNTPLFYLICFSVALGWMYWVMRCDLWHIQQGKKARTHSSFQSDPLPVKSVEGCERCGRLTNNLLEIESADGAFFLLCSSCQVQTTMPKAYQRYRRVQFSPQMAPRRLRGK